MKGVVELRVCMSASRRKKKDLRMSDGIGLKARKAWRTRRAETRAVPGSKREPARSGGNYGSASKLRRTSCWMTYMGTSRRNWLRE